MSKDTIKVSKARGSPMLTWVGKRPLTQVKAFPAQLIERFTAEGEAGDTDRGRLAGEAQYAPFRHLLIPPVYTR